MKPVEIIRLGIIAIALLLAYGCIIRLIEFIGFLPDFLSGDKPDGRGFGRIFLTIAGYFAGFWLLIKYNRKISNYIEEQK